MSDEMERNWPEEYFDYGPDADALENVCFWVLGTSSSHKLALQVWADDGGHDQG